MSTILKIFAFPASIIIICLGISTILGGHITPGGGFQGGAIIAAGFIFCAIVYGFENTPFKFTHRFMATLESIGAIGYILLGLAGLLLSGYFLYNIGVDLYNLLPASIGSVFNYPDAVHAGIIPYLNILIGLKVLVGLSAVVITFLEFKGE
ncbi:MAG TPA: cation:proton antiporter [Methanothermobacter sp.]|jgi:energy-converting hydrogenase B subunit I|uniref:Cation:proton antiporter n=1 Tax=Methanothermobacter tenebrarum TaxID=680118 RepID=A0ABM7YBX7_9EURY|nr:MnhB domain-containing protein [Methanothermobacter tenebrarum]MDD3454761.1 MnhB domain-containing protein [Methanobacteriales archaeon]MDX9693266.1 MnhB domain-containing protein [Methanothermobacter sp.]BDH78805.1 cation:proton antiporter [Methanothermobacter tenebrarum]HHW17015.1 cation:proton antiporter [Methanothermobacter sp.]HOQ20744.1 MnhB domain-containing protein [Methanothermobacter sp.]